MGFEGDLKHINLADVFQNIQANSLSGTLRVEDNGRTAYALFHDGKISGFVAGAEADRPSLAELLLKHRLVSQSALGKALKRVGRRSLAKVLEEDGVIERDDQLACVRVYVQDEVCDLFTWKQARFRFDEGPPPGEVAKSGFGRLEASIDATSLLIEAARRSDEWERIRRRIPSFREVLSPSGEPPADEELSDVERDVLAALDGQTDLDQVIAALPYGRFAVAEAACALLEHGAIRPLEAGDLRERGEALRADGRLEEARRILERALELERGSPEGRGALAEVYVGLGRRDEAVDQLKQMAFSLEDQGRRDHAVVAYRRAVALAPKDLGLHEALVRLAEAKGADPAERARATRDLARAALDQHLYDRAIGVLKPLLELEDQRGETRDLLAKAYLKKADVQAAISIYVEEAKERIQADDDQGAQQALGGILELDPEHTWASARLREVRHQSLRLRRKDRRRRSRRALIGLVLLVLCAQGVREKFAFDLTRQGFERSARKAGDGSLSGLREATGALAQVGERYPVTASAFYAGLALVALADHEIAEAQSILGQAVGTRARAGASGGPLGKPAGSPTGLTGVTPGPGGAAPPSSPAAEPAAARPEPSAEVRRVFAKMVDARRERLAVLVPALDGHPDARDRALRTLNALEAARTNPPQ